MIFHDKMYYMTALKFGMNFESPWLVYVLITSADVHEPRRRRPVVKYHFLCEHYSTYREKYCCLEVVLNF